MAQAPPCQPLPQDLLHPVDFDDVSLPRGAPSTGKSHRASRDRHLAWFPDCQGPQGAAKRDVPSPCSRADSLEPAEARRVRAPFSMCGLRGSRRRGSLPSRRHDASRRTRIRGKNVERSGSGKRRMLATLVPRNGSVSARRGHMAALDEPLSAIDKLGVTGSIPVPPIT
jgi:hypothetical protein